MARLWGRIAATCQNWGGLSIARGKDSADGRDEDGNGESMTGRDPLQQSLMHAGKDPAISLGGVPIQD
jgi:hypothetical protein